VSFFGSIFTSTCFLPSFGFSIVTDARPARTGNRRMGVVPASFPFTCTVPQGLAFTEMDPIATAARSVFGFAFASKGDVVVLVLVLVLVFKAVVFSIGAGAMTRATTGGGGRRMRVAKIAPAAINAAAPTPIMTGTPRRRAAGAAATTVRLRGAS
jgi:hypothetical protein